MDNQIFTVNYYDKRHERVTLYSGIPMNMDVIRLMVNAYEAVEAQFVHSPIMLVHTHHFHSLDSGYPEALGVPVWGENICLITPDDMNALGIDKDSVFCVNRSFLSCIDSPDDNVDDIDVLGHIEFGVIKEIYEKQVCFICLVIDEPLPAVEMTHDIE